MQRYHTYLFGLTILSLAPSLFAEEPAFPTVDCVISPSKIVEISAAVPGVVEKLYVDRSHLVTKGQLLAELSADVEKSSVRLAEARVKMTAELSAEQVNLKYDRLQSQRVSQLREKKLASLQTIDEANRIQKVTYWRLKQAEETLALRQLELERSQAQLKEKSIYSTIEGVVAERYKHEGEYVEEQPVFRLVQLNPLHVDAVFPMEYYTRFQPGMTATIYPEIDQKQGYNAEIELVDPLGDAASGTFGVRLVLDNSESKLPAGLKCFLQIDEHQSADSITAESEKANSELNTVTDVPAEQKIEQPTIIKGDTEKNAVSVKENSTDIAETEETGKDKNREPDQLETLDPDINGEESRVSMSDNLTVDMDASDDRKDHSLNLILVDKQLGPFSSLDQLNPITAKLDAEGVPYQSVTTSKNVPKGYLVLSSSEYTQRGSVLLSRFADAGVRDMGRLPKNSYGGRISFGAYKGPIQADARKVKLAKLGIKAEVITRYRQINQHWLNVQSMPQPLFEQLNADLQD